MTNQSELEFLESLYLHKRYVFEAGLKIGGIPVDRLANHDASKFWPEEFPHYARQFHGNKDDPVGWAGAWLHHIHHNPHHWQHWIFPDSYSPKGSGIKNGLVIMPEPYVREMVADWMGASRAYTHNWDMSDWLKKSLPKIEKYLNPGTIFCLSEVLVEQGYSDIVDMMKWWDDEIT
jgi:hypothetical protein